MKESENLDDQYVSILLEKQVRKIIADNNAKDLYFSIRQIFDLDQFVWDIATDIYKSSGYRVDLLKIKKLVLEHQSSAWNLYQQEQEKVRQENIRIEEEIQIKKELKQKHQAEQEKPILEKVLSLIQTIPELEGSIVKGKVYLCLTEIIAEDFDADVNEITWETDFEEHLKRETYEEYLSRINNSRTWCSGSNFGFDNFSSSCIEFIMSIEEMLDIEITDEDSEKYLTTVGNFTNYIIAQFKDNPDELERQITEYLLNEQ